MPEVTPSMASSKSLIPPGFSGTRCGFVLFSSFHFHLHFSVSDTERFLWTKESSVRQWETKVVRGSFSFFFSDEICIISQFDKYCCYRAGWPGWSSVSRKAGCPISLSSP